MINFDKLLHLFKLQLYPHLLYPFVKLCYRYPQLLRPILTRPMPYDSLSILLATSLTD